MKNLRKKYLGGMVAIGVLACANLVQASTTYNLAPQIALHHTQVSSNKVNIDLGMSNLQGEVVALEISIVADHIQAVQSITSKVSNSYITYSLQTLSDDKEKLTIYMVAQDKDTPFVLEAGKLSGVSLSLQTSGKLELDRTNTRIKVIKKDYETATYEAAEIVYTETAYDQDSDNNKPENGGSNDETNNGNNNGGNNNNDNTNNGNNNNNNNTGNNQGGTTTKPNKKPSSSGSNNTVNNNNLNNNEQMDNESNNGVAINFSDVENHWAKSAISNMASKGIIKGYADGTFKPNASITRGEFATLLARAFNLETTSAISPFKDVTTDKWYAESILALYEAGITSGRADGTFGAGAPITNEEISAMIARTITVLNLTLPETNTAGITFTDSKQISSYAKEAVTMLTKYGILSGKPDGSFGPKLTTTRAQVAVILDRIFTIIK